MCPIRSDSTLYVPPRTNNPEDLWSLVEIRGTYLSWKVLRQNEPLNIKKRGCVTTFSAKSRWAMICRLAQIDWKETVTSHFVTCTFPDQLGRPDRKNLSLYRQHFWRDIEKRMKRHVSAVWRIEWKIRLSGIYEGEPMPHYHLLVFDSHGMNNRMVNGCWMRAIGEKNYVNTDCQRMKDEKQVAAYVAKYASKVDESILGNSTKHTIPGGRQWGTLRKSILPLATQRMLLIPPCQEADRVYAEVVRLREMPKGYYRSSFKHCGPLAATLSELLRNEMLDTVGEDGIINSVDQGNGC